MDLGDTIRGGSGGGDKGRAFRATHGVLFASAGIKAGLLGRDAGGRYTTFQNELYAVNQRLAEELQALMLERLESSRVPSRRGVASGRLAAALGDRRNRQVTNAGFGVGSIAWLDKSEAKYWRSIEVGTSQFVGNEIPMGLWGDTLSGSYGGSSRFGPYPLATGSWSVSGTRRSDRLRPMGKSFAYRHLIEGGMARREAFLALRTQKAIITQPIEAHRYMAGAWSDFHAGSRTTAAVRRALRISGITPG